jgi:hypothetical protein
MSEIRLYQASTKTLKTEFLRDIENALILKGAMNKNETLFFRNFIAPFIINALNTYESQRPPISFHVTKDVIEIYQK